MSWLRQLPMGWSTYRGVWGASNLQGVHPNHGGCPNPQVVSPTCGRGEGPPTCPTHGGATTYGGAFNPWGCPQPAGDPAQPMGGALNAWVVLEPEGVPEPEGCPHRVGGIAVLRGCMNLRGAPTGWGHRC